jgi:probable HAF family extracellular repeat protein
MRYSKRWPGFLTALLGATLMMSPVCWAKKPSGGGGGGGAAYNIVPFRPPDFESVSSRVLGLNETGHAVGFAERTPGDYQAVHLDLATGVYTSLKSGWVAHGVNKHNEIVGEVLIPGEMPADDLTFALFWSRPSADPVLLPVLPGDVESRVSDINDGGIVVGTSVDENGRGAGVVCRVLIDDNGDPRIDGPLPLAPFAGDADSWTTDVNELADGLVQVCGSSRGDGIKEAVVWTVSLNLDGTLAAPGPPQGLGTLGLDDPSDSGAAAINDSGTVCGSSDGWPFIAPAGQGVQPLDVARKATYGAAGDVNDDGHVVGVLEFSEADRHAYLWKNGDVIDLEKQISRNAGWGRLWWANRVNNGGVIAGWGSYDVQSRGFLLIPN